LKTPRRYGTTTTQISQNLGSRLDVPYKITMQPTFENYTCHEMLKTLRLGATKVVRKFSKVGSLLGLLYTLTTKPTFENMYLSRQLEMPGCYDVTMATMMDTLQHNCNTFATHCNTLQHRRKRFTCRDSWRCQVATV
jgi:hypothetical protein